MAVMKIRGEDGKFYEVSSIQGAPGVTPIISVGIVETLPAGSQATADITGETSNLKLNLGIPQGYGGITQEEKSQLDKATMEIGDVFGLTSAPTFESGFYQRSGDIAIENNLPGVYSRAKIDISKMSGRNITFSTYIASSTPCFVVSNDMSIVQEFSTDLGNPNHIKIFSFEVLPSMSFLLINTYNYPEKMPTVNGIQKSTADWISEFIHKKTSEEDLSEELREKINSSFSSIHPVVISKNRVPVVSDDFVAIFIDNIFQNYSVEGIQTIKSTNVACRVLEKRVLYFSSSNVGNTSTQVRLYQKDDSLYSAYAPIPFTVIPDTDGTKRVLFIGDSITENMSYLTPLREMSDSGNYKIKFIGTLGSEIKNEGRGGWAAYNYATNDLSRMSTSATNAFWDGEKFNFSWYMQENGFDGLDFVFINLGTNDMIRGIHDTSDIEEITSVISSSYTTMVSSIREYSPNIPIILWLPPTRSLIGGNNHIAIDRSLIANKILIETFDKSSYYNDNVYLMPTQLYVDPYNDYPSFDVDIFGSIYKDGTEAIHPSQDGGKKIAKGILNQMKLIDYLGKVT